MVKSMKHMQLVPSVQEFHLWKWPEHMQHSQMEDTLQSLIQSKNVVIRDTGEVIEFSGETKQVMSDATAFMISDVLQDVALTGGTPTNVAAKTGTTNYDDETMEKYNLPSDAIRDSWVVGYSTKTVIALWYGLRYN